MTFLKCQRAGRYIDIAAYTVSIVFPMRTLSTQERKPDTHFNIRDAICTGRNISEAFSRKPTSAGQTAGEKITAWAPRPVAMVVHLGRPIQTAGGLWDPHRGISRGPKYGPKSCQVRGLTRKLSNFLLTISFMVPQAQHPVSSGGLRALKP